jgi:glycosyltransferase 2 family protein
MRWKRFLGGVLLAAAILFLILRRVDPHAVWLALAHVTWPWLVVAQGLGWLSVFIKGERWSLAIASGAAARPRRRLFAASMIGTAANMILPARLGDVLRALVLRKHNAVPTARGLLASWSAQAFDVAAVGLLLLAGTAAGEGLASGRLIALLLAGLVAGAATAALLARRPEILIRAAARLPRIGAKAAATAEHAAAGLRFLSEPAVLARMALLTVFTWTCDVTATWISLRAFHLDVGLAAAALLISAIGLSFALPLTPGNVGTYQLIALYVLGRFGVEREPAVAYGLGAQAFSLAATVALGAALFQREGLSFAAVADAPPAEEAEPASPQTP